jgi:hypothetical protein
MENDEITEYETICYFCNGVKADPMKPCLACGGTGLLITKKGMILLEFVQRRLLDGIS